MRILILSYLLVLLSLACKQTTISSNHSDIEQINKAIVNDNTSTIELFDRWEKVWQKGQYDLISSCVADKYIRHDTKGDRILTREEYEKEIKETRNSVPDIKFLVYDNAFSKNQAWLRYTMTYTDPETRELVASKGIQVYRIENGKLAETWMIMLEPGTKWTDKNALKCWSCAE